jgi:hypothetical protein
LIDAAVPGQPIRDDGDNGAGIGASHQTGWTGLAALTATPFHATSAADWPTRGRDTLRPAAESPQAES